jgi:WD40 repeat protein
VEERIDGPGGMIDDLAWARSGSLVALVANGKAFLIASPGEDAPEPLATQTRAAHVALDRAGKRAAVSTETGEIAIFNLESGDPPRVATPSLQPVAAIAFAREHLLVAGSDGVLRALDLATARETAHIDTGSPLVQLAVDADGGRAATATRDGVIRLHAVPDGDVTATLSWHQANVAALGFGAGPTLVSADNDGELALWDLEAGGPVEP